MMWGCEVIWEDVFENRDIQLKNSNSKIMIFSSDQQLVGAVFQTLAKFTAKQVWTQSTDSIMHKCDEVAPPAGK